MDLRTFAQVVQPQRDHASRKAAKSPCALKKLEDISLPIEKEGEGETESENVGLIDVDSRVRRLWRAIIGAKCSPGRILIYLSVLVSIDSTSRTLTHRKPLHAFESHACPPEVWWLGPPVSLYVTPLTDTHANLAGELFRDSSLIFSSRSYLAGNDGRPGGGRVARAEVIIENVKIIEGCAFNEQLERNACSIKFRDVRKIGYTPIFHSPSCFNYTSRYSAVTNSM